MKSMTGYGSSEISRNGWKISVELSSVNRKQSEISVNLPRELEVLEAQIRDEVNRNVSRGRVTVRVVMHASQELNARRIQLNVPLAEAYARQFRHIAGKMKIPGDVTLDNLLRAPGVVEMHDNEMDAEQFWPSVENALKKALDKMLKMREQEGSHLSKDLVARIQIMRKATARIQKIAPLVQKRYREQLLDRVQKAGIESINEERLLKEIVLFADRSDITEELTRLQSHFAQFDNYVKSKDAVGRTLDFLAQEMNREINTIGSKANDSQISLEVVTLKTELEKFREQAMNVE